MRSDASASPRRPATDRPPQLPPLPPDSLARALWVAAEAVAQVREGYALNDGLASLWSAHPDLPPATRGAAQDLIFGTLRDYGRGDAMLARLLRQPLTEPTIDALLRVALHRLEVRPDTAHTVVDQAVEVAARVARGGLKGLVNAVLRNALRQRDTLASALTRSPEAHWRHPVWWIERLKRNAPHDWETALAASNMHPPMTLRINPRRSAPEAVIAGLVEKGYAGRPLGPHGWRLDHPVPVATLPGYAEGLLSVQDWGAQQAAPLLDVAPGMRVLDACAAPGGKAAHLLELTDCQLTAIDADPRRVLRIEKNLERLGLVADVRCGDAREPRFWWDGLPFDRILADVPCSASGVTRRHPDIKWLRRADDIGNFATVQREILDALWPLLAPGGKMLYVTCSVFPEENSLQIARFAGSHADCRRAPLGSALERTLLPDADHDGFFFALLEKQA
ncbi:16S rRNA (cytosine(967)-C(5))-methyltransferase RsmB [Niveibacterium umoris]|uniref:16S rRNA (cytosine(967)-C(5))-methyltransferase n=1 Tax=Niveibacterium umoris TaxID=1193620 RepID=A0A840BSX3_9RHOO|nr:16S rRNA (cytosine(967)-C(5))-methyltransferase RsmB [Niveibacterium umoris]MBB4013916.1 16S rRNA (cytosine967-C5)-methyltransferase [Niveibacterium umoris]